MEITRENVIRKFGDYSYGKKNISIAWWGEQAQLDVGKFCSIAKCTIFLGGIHRSDWITTYPFGHINKGTFPHHGEGHPKTNGDVIIGNDVCIGQGSTIMSGVSIGNGAVIAANSHVVHDVSPYSIVGGNPAKHIASRFSDEDVDRLLQLRWWDWPIDKIKANADILCSSNLNELCQIK